MSEEVKLIPISEWPMVQDPETGTVYMVSEKGHWHAADQVIKTMEEVLAKNKVGRHERKESHG